MSEDKKSEDIEIIMERINQLENNQDSFVREIRRLDDKILLVYQEKSPTEADIILEGPKGKRIIIYKNKKEVNNLENKKV